MIYKTLKQIYNFSLLTKTPKAVKPPQQSTSWFGKLFRKNQNSVTYVLLQQLFTYLETTNLIQKQFPYLKNLQRFQQNSMILHVHLLRERIKQETQLPRSQLQKYQYNLQTVFFPNYSSFVNKAIPTQNFSQHYAQAYLKKLQLYSQLINELEWAINPNKQSITSQQYSLLFKKLIYENRVEVGNIQLLKFCKYYLAHKKYLSMLDWNDMVNYRVKWGLESLRYIGEVQEISKNDKNDKNNNKI